MNTVPDAMPGTATANTAPDRAWLRLVQRRARSFHWCIDPSRVREGQHVMAQIAAVARDFESAVVGGRGESYRRAQQSTSVRIRGIRGLFERLSPTRELRRLPGDFTAVDVLGGDGVLARVLGAMAGERFRDQVLTSDVSEDMVRAAASYGLPAVRQAAQYLIVKDSCVDAVILAYGTHHIPTADRPRACAEAYRVLRPGGRLVLHDFEPGSPAARWFSEIVDRHSRTGHAYAHVTPREMFGYLAGAGFCDISVEPLYDPFIVTAESEAGARRELATYLLHMYGLDRLVEQYGHEPALDRVYEMAVDCFQYDYHALGLEQDFGVSRVEFFPVDGRIGVELPRVALVAAGTRPPRAAGESPFAVAASHPSAGRPEREETASPRRYPEGH
jgi:SAM-dependent methyltransferase